MQRDFGLVDLPFPTRLVELTPIGTLRASARAGTHAYTITRGVDVFPSVGDSVLLPEAAQFQAIVEGEGSEIASRVLIGHCPTAAGAPVFVDPDKLFGRHLAVLGNTGSGKSCTVSGLVRWSLEEARARREAQGIDGPPNARFIILDPNGEYGEVFTDLGARTFGVEPSRDAYRKLQVPAWLWNGDEWAAFTNAAPGVQRPILFEALRRLRSNLGKPDEFETEAIARIRRYRGRVRVIVDAGDHMRPGRREGVADALNNMRDDFNALSGDARCPGELQPLLETVATVASEVEQGARGQQKPDGFWHTDFSETELQRVDQALDEVRARMGLEEEDALLDEGSPRPFPMDQLPDYVSALASTHGGRDIAQFVDTLNLRIRGLLSAGRLSSVVESGDATAVSLEEWLEAYIGGDGAANGPIVVIDLSLVPSEITHIAVSVLARMVFEAVQRYRREHGQELPTTIILEEAHNFIHRDLSAEGAAPASQTCAKVFERIAREGRKFGLGLVLASQRPSEISPTVLSQCNTFLLHRIVNDRDQELVRKLVPDGFGTLLRDLPSLPSRRAFLLGWAAPAPVLVEIQSLPERDRPHSPDPAFWAVWTGEEDRPIDWPAIAAPWQKLSAESATEAEASSADS